MQGTCADTHIRSMLHNRHTHTHSCQRVKISAGVKEYKQHISGFYKQRPQINFTCWSDWYLCDLSWNSWSVFKRTHKLGIRLYKATPSAVNTAEHFGAFGPFFFCSSAATLVPHTQKITHHSFFNSSPPPCIQKSLERILDLEDLRRVRQIT